MVAKTFRVTGRVQGVGFRWSAQEEARRLNLAGWVSNGQDNSVSGLVQGSESAVEQFAVWLGRGPRSARVDKVELKDVPLQGLRIFTVR
jgi:acylphosphatase